MEQKHSATPKKIRDARKKGQVSKSQDLLRLMGMWVVFEAACAFQGPLRAGFISLFELPSLLLRMPFEEAVTRLLTQAVLFAGVLVYAAMGFLIAAKMLATWLQSGFVFSLTPLAPSLARLNPAQQLSQMFTLNKLWDLMSGILKIILIAGIGFGLLKNRFAAMIGMSHLEVAQLWEAIQWLFVPVVRVLFMMLVAVSLLDVAMQRFFYKKRLKMSDQELKQEKKSQDGDPHIKGKRRMIAQQLLMSPPAPGLDVVKGADVVVVNPTHIAIALSYTSGETPLPVVIYKASDDKALETIAFAKEQNIPVIRYLWLARNLHQTTPVGSPIPRDTLQAVATVFRVIKQLADQSELLEEGEEIYEIRRQ